jgi:hypothetical protein
MSALLIVAKPPSKFRYPPRQLGERQNLRVILRESGRRHLLHRGLNWILHKRKTGFTFPHVRRVAERRQPRSLAPISREAAQKRQFVGDELNFGTWPGATRHGYFQRCIGKKVLWVGASVRFRTEQ